MICNIATYSVLTLMSGCQLCQASNNFFVVVPRFYPALSKVLTDMRLQT